ncbi:MAG: hypothetical protein M1832_001183 [Thelocarpon impressellum]|nr:MAG: hypothetical protein M1832_001183 [Thelocarpon impressellum]
MPPHPPASTAPNEEISEAVLEMWESNVGSLFKTMLDENNLPFMKMMSDLDKTCKTMLEERFPGYKPSGNSKGAFMDTPAEGEDLEMSQDNMESFEAKVMNATPDAEEENEESRALQATRSEHVEAVAGTPCNELHEAIRDRARHLMMRDVKSGVSKYVVSLVVLATQINRTQLAGTGLPAKYLGLLRKSRELFAEELVTEAEYGAAYAEGDRAHHSYQSCGDWPIFARLVRQKPWSQNGDLDFFRPLIIGKTVEEMAPDELASAETFPEQALPQTSPEQDLRDISLEQALTRAFLEHALTQTQISPEQALTNTSSDSSVEHVEMAPHPPPSKPVPEKDLEAAIEGFQPRMLEMHQMKWWDGEEAFRRLNGQKLPDEAFEEQLRELEARHEASMAEKLKAWTATTATRYAETAASGRTALDEIEEMMLRESRRQEAADEMRCLMFKLKEAAEKRFVEWAAAQLGVRPKGHLFHYYLELAEVATNIDRKLLARLGLPAKYLGLLRTARGLFHDELKLHERHFLLGHRPHLYPQNEDWAAFARLLLKPWSENGDLDFFRPLFHLIQGRTLEAMSAEWDGRGWLGRTGPKRSG